MTVVGVHAGGFLVQSHDQAVSHLSIVIGEADAVALGELGQLHRALGLGQQTQALDHHVVEVHEVLLAHVAQGLNEQVSVQDGVLVGAHGAIFT